MEATAEDISAGTFDPAEAFEALTGVEKSAIFMLGSWP